MPPGRRAGDPLVKNVGRPRLVDGAGREDVGQARRIFERASVLAAVAGRGDDERALGEGDGDHRVQQRVPEVRAEAEVDDALPGGDRRVQALDDVAGGDPVSERARVPDLEIRLRIDADDPEAVRRRRGGRGDGRAVLVGLGGRGLRVQRGRRRPVRELLVREVDAGVDDRQRLARAGRLGSVEPDKGGPPLQAVEERTGR